jgi:hypothetical protein
MPAREVADGDSLMADIAQRANADEELAAVPLHTSDVTPMIVMLPVTSDDDNAHAATAAAGGAVVVGQ